MKLNEIRKTTSSDLNKELVELKQELVDYVSEKFTPKQLVTDVNIICGDSASKEAKEKVGKVAAIAGAMKTSTLMLKTPQEVEDEVKEMFDILAPGGGFISANSVALDYVTPENMHAWRDAVEKYGSYK